MLPHHLDTACVGLKKYAYVQEWLIVVAFAAGRLNLRRALAPKGARVFQLIDEDCEMRNLDTTSALASYQLLVSLQTRWLELRALLFSCRLAVDTRYPDCCACIAWKDVDP